MNNFNKVLSNTVSASEARGDDLKFIRNKK